MEDFCTLVETAQSGNKAAYEMLVDRFQNMAYAIAYRHVGDYMLAQDVVQNSWIEAYLHLSQLKEPMAFPGWFHQIVFHQCHRLLRQASPEYFSLDMFSSTEIDACSLQDIVERRELQREVQQAICTLPEQERQISMHFYISGYSQQEISELLGLPVYKIKKRLYSARQRLKRRLSALIQDAIADIGASKKSEEVIVFNGVISLSATLPFSSNVWTISKGEIRARRFYPITTTSPEPYASSKPARFRSNYTGSPVQPYISSHMPGSDLLPQATYKRLVSA